MRALVSLALPLLLAAGCASTQQRLESGRLFDACKKALASPETEAVVAAWLRDAIAPTLSVRLLTPAQLDLLFGPEVAARIENGYAVAHARVTWEARPDRARAADPPFELDSLHLLQHRWRVTSASGAFEDLPSGYAEAHDLERGPRPAATAAAGKERFNLLGGIADALVGGLTLGGVDLELRKRGASTRELEDLAHIVKMVAQQREAPGAEAPAMGTGGLIALLERRACEAGERATCDDFVLLKRKGGATEPHALELTLSYRAMDATGMKTCHVRDPVRVPLAPGADLGASLQATFPEGPRELREIVR
jgi:hypothetical protein